MPLLEEGFGIDEPQVEDLPKRTMLVTCKHVFKQGLFCGGSFLSLRFKGIVYEATYNASTLTIGNYRYFIDDFVEASAIEKLQFYNKRRKNERNKESKV